MLEKVGVGSLTLALAHKLDVHQGLNSATPTRQAPAMHTWLEAYILDLPETT